MSFLITWVELWGLKINARCHIWFFTHPYIYRVVSLLKMNWLQWLRYQWKGFPFQWYWTWFTEFAFSFSRNSQINFLRSWIFISQFPIGQIFKQNYIRTCRVLLYIVRFKAWITVHLNWNLILPHPFSSTLELKLPCKIYLYMFIIIHSESQYLSLEFRYSRKYLSFAFRTYIRNLSN